MASRRATIADMSFYVFFIGDIDGPGYLTAIADLGQKDQMAQTNRQRPEPG